MRRFAPGTTGSELLLLLLFEREREGSLPRVPERRVEGERSLFGGNSYARVCVCVGGARESAPRRVPLSNYKCDFRPGSIV